MDKSARLRRVILGTIARVTCRHPVAVLLIGLVLTAVATSGLTRLRLETGIADYLPADSPVVQRFTRAIEHYGGADQLVLALFGDEEDALAREELADAIAEGLEEGGRVSRVEYRFGGDNPDAARSSILDLALFYLDDARLERLEESLSTDAIFERVRQNKQVLRSPAGLAAKELVTRDPLGLSRLFAEQFRDLKGNLDVRFMDGYAFSEDLGLLVMLVKPVRPAQDLTFTVSFLEEVDRVVRRARKEIEADLGEDALAGVEVRMTGGYPIARQYNDLLQADLLWTLGIAFVGIMGLFLIAFRRVGSLLYVGLPLIVGVVWTMGFAGFAIGRLNLFTAGAAAVLLGLAIDFAIHLFNRYVSERDAGRSIDEAIHGMLVDTGDGVLTAGLTSVAAFAACTVGGIDGLAHLGIICAAGMILGMAANFTLMPAFLKLRRGRRHRESYRDTSFNFGLGWLAHKVVERPLVVVAAWVVLTGVFAWGLFHIEVDTNMRSLRPKRSEAIALQDEITSRIGSSLTYNMLLTEDVSLAAVLERNGEIARRLDDLVEQGEVVFYLSLANIVPSPARQRHVIEWLQTHRRQDANGLDLDRIEADLARAMEAEGFRLGPQFEETVSLLRRVLKPRETPPAELLDDPAIRERARRFIREEPDRVEVVTYVYPRRPEGTAQYRVVDLLEDRVIRDLPDTHMIGMSILGRELKNLVQRGAANAAILALALVIGLLWLHFRNLKYVLLTAVPLFLGVIGAIGGVSLLGLRLNMVNMSIVAIILGIGIDDGIHIVHRFLDEGKHRVVETFRFAGRAVVITSLTTMVGFGSLIFASYKGLFTAGIFAIVGVGMCLLSSITLLPALLQIVVVRPEERARLAVTEDDTGPAAVEKQEA